MLRFTLALAALACSLLPAAHGEAPARLSADRLAAKIDEHVARRWKERKVTPAPLADDAAFVRRAHLDLAGRIPDILAARDFIDDTAADKRSRLLDRLLADERYAAHWANVWRGWLLPEASEQLAALAPGFESWLRLRLRDNVRYDRLVRALVLGRDPSFDSSYPYPFYLANQGKPENLAAATSRLFLGVKLECAQCHNHPFARWTRQQFWETAAFFAGTTPESLGLAARRGSDVPVVRPGTIRVPGSERTVKARFLGGKEAAWKDDPRVALVDWMVAKDNPYFARALANRLWEHLLGTGLVEPVDEESADNPPSHPELLGLLAEQFAANDYDLKYLLKAITMSRAYQLAGRQTHAGQAELRLFARARVRGLSPEQLYDSLALATGLPEEPPQLPGRGMPDLASPRAEFLRRFPAVGKRAEQQTSILQALYLMNGRVVGDATTLEHNRNLAIIAEAKSVKTSRRVEQLFLIALSRKPTAAEGARLSRYVERGGPSGDPAQAMCDVFWALLNSSEFCVNH